MFATTSDELLRHFRAEVSDATEPYLWEDWEVYGYMTEAFDALLKEANVVEKVLVLNGAAGDSQLRLPKSVTHIRSARFAYAAQPDNSTLLAAGSHTHGSARCTTTDDAVTAPPHGAPTAYIRDYDRSALRLNAAPQEPYTLELQCVTTLSLPMVAGLQLPSTDAEDLRLALHYMKWQAYQKHDAETEDLVRANSHAQQFRLGAQERESRLRNYRRPPGVVRMEGVW